MRVAVFSIVPSPYQRDLFRAIVEQAGVELTVYYAERSSPDSPWPTVALADYEKVLRGFWIGTVTKRFIINPFLPPLRDADIIVLNGYITLPAQRILRGRLRVPCVFWAERMVGHSSGLGRWAHRLLAQPLNRISGIMAIGRKAAADYRMRWPGKPVMEVPYFCDLKAFSAFAPKRPRLPVRILFCGQMIPRKGVDLLLSAFARLVGEGLPVCLSLVGREADLPQMMSGLAPEVRAKVDYLGFKAPEELPRCFADADVFVLPSRYDGWGVVVNQALGAGLPVVCSSAVGSADSLVQNGLNGAVFPSGDLDALTMALRKLVQSPAQIEAFSAHSRAMARDLEPESGARRWVQFLKSILDSTR